MKILPSLIRPLDSGWQLRQLISSHLVSFRSLLRLSQNHQMVLVKTLSRHIPNFLTKLLKNVLCGNSNQCCLYCHSSMQSSKKERNSERLDGTYHLTSTCLIIKFHINWSIFTWTRHMNQVTRYSLGIPWDILLVMPCTEVESPMILIEEFLSRIFKNI